MWGARGAARGATCRECPAGGRGGCCCHCCIRGWGKGSGRGREGKSPGCSCSCSSSSAHFPRRCRACTAAARVPWHLCCCSLCSLLPAPPRPLLYLLLGCRGKPAAPAPQPRPLPPCKPPAPDARRKGRGLGHCGNLLLCCCCCCAAGQQRSSCSGSSARGLLRHSSSAPTTGGWGCVQCALHIRRHCRAGGLYHPSPHPLPGQQQHWQRWQRCSHPCPCHCHCHCHCTPHPHLHPSCRLH